MTVPLKSWRAGLASDLADVLGIDKANGYAAPPRSPVRPCVILSPDPDTYLVPEGATGHFVMRYQAVILAGADLPADAADELDDYLDRLMDTDHERLTAAPIRVAAVSGMASYALAGGQHPGVAVDFEMLLCWTPPAEQVVA